MSSSSEIFNNNLMLDEMTIKQQENDSQGKKRSQ
jgi:hypothetical protein